MSYRDDREALRARNEELRTQVEELRAAVAKLERERSRDAMHFRNQLAVRELSSAPAMVRPSTRKLPGARNHTMLFTVLSLFVGMLAMVVWGRC